MNIDTPSQAAEPKIVKQDRYLVLAEVAHLVRVHSATITRQWKNGNFLAPMIIGRKQLWLKSEVEAFLQDSRGKS